MFPATDLERINQATQIVILSVIEVTCVSGQWIEVFRNVAADQDARYIRTYLANTFPSPLFYIYFFFLKIPKPPQASLNKLIEFLFTIILTISVKIFFKLCIKS